MTNTTRTPAQWPENYDDHRFDLETLNSHFEYRRALMERADHLAKICLKENLFNNTFLPKDLEEDRGCRWRESHLSSWEGSTPEFVSSPDYADDGDFEYSLTVYRGCGEYESTTVAFPAKSLLAGNLEDFLQERRTRRDAYLNSLREKKVVQEHKKQENELARKKAQLEALKKELGEA